jgi:formylglycine-generating enzyme required for sulfatase activity
MKTSASAGAMIATVFILIGSLAASERTAASTYPLWDGHESVAEYANKVNLPTTKTLELSGGIKLELVLIPAGKFIMGTPEPTPVDEETFDKQIITSKALLAANAAALLVMLIVVAFRAIRENHRPQWSLGRGLLMTLAAGGCVLSGLHWRQSVNQLLAARKEFVATSFRYNEAKPREKPSHTVILTNPFYMSKFTVTQEQYQAVIGANPSHFKGKDLPVEKVSWDDAQSFCQKLTEQKTLTVRLPMEAEWEYACRAGTTTTYHCGDAQGDLNRVAWYLTNSSGTTHPVGQKEPNAFGLYDMHGNVWQFCQDWYGVDYYVKSAAIDPDGPAQGVCHVLRGGSWCYSLKDCRSARRFRDVPGSRFNFMGFRVVTGPAFRTP